MADKGELTILGCASATPTANDFPTAQILQMSGRYFLLDCGEGTQMQIRRYRIPMARIQVIFITHLHGDHFFGLPGLISSFHLMGRESSLLVVGPKGLGDLIMSILRAQGTWLKFDLKFEEVTEEGICFSDERLEVVAYGMDHRIDCFGYCFREKLGKRKLLSSSLKKYDIPIYMRDRIKKGEDLTLKDGSLILNSELTSDPDPPRSYMFFSDTAYQPVLAKKIGPVDLMYHEATFHSSDQSKADMTKHSTSTEAAMMAKDMGAKKLLIGHISGRYKDREALLEEARSIHPDSELAFEGMQITW
jgi:ribonuclease Z